MEERRRDRETEWMDREKRGKEKETRDRERNACRRKKYRKGLVAVSIAECSRSFLSLRFNF